MAFARITRLDHKLDTFMEINQMIVDDSCWIQRLDIGRISAVYNISLETSQDNSQLVPRVIRTTSSTSSLLLICRFTLSQLSFDEEINKYASSRSFGAMGI